MINYIIYSFICRLNFFHSNSYNYDRFKFKILLTNIHSFLWPHRYFFIYFNQNLCYIKHAMVFIIFFMLYFS